MTRDDLDEIGRASLRSIRPGESAGELIGIVDRGQLGDTADAGYALLLAAEIYERSGDVEAAAATASRAVAVYRRHDPAAGYPTAYRAELLFKMGRFDEAMADFTALKPLLMRDVSAVTYLTEMLVSCGQAALALHWSTEALHALLAARDDAAGSDGAAGRDDAAVVAYTLAQRRRAMREASGLPPDGLDLLADRLREELSMQLDEQEDHEPDEGASVLFWPCREFAALLQRWPSLAAVYGHDWDDHRFRIELALTLYAEAGHVGLTLLTGVVTELADHLAQIGGTPDDPEARQGYVERLADHQHGAPWPPGRNDPCWCGSNSPYRRCCRPRSDQ